MKQTPEALERERRPCPHCKGDGFYWAVPSGVNVFEMDILTLAKSMTKYVCGCAHLNPGQEG